MSNLFVDIIIFLFYMLFYVVESLVKTCIPRSWKAKDVSRETVLITGGGSGIGQEMAIRFAKLGSTVIIWDIDKQGMDKTTKEVEKIGGKIFSYVCDLTKREDVYKIADKVKEEVGVVTILVNNAGIVTGKPLMEAPDHMIQRTFDVNILAHFWTVKSFLNDMIKFHRGHIVTVSSLAGHMGVNKLVDYCASKFAAVGFDESLHQELRSLGAKKIVTTVICPYYINTGMFEGTTGRLYSHLTPEYTVDVIMEGILANERVVFIPRSIYSTVIAKMLLPWKAFLHLYEKVGETDKGMLTFTGRKPVKQE